MRPAMMLLLRALVILGAVLAVISCGNALGAPLGSTDSGSPLSSGTTERCHAALFALENRPAAGGALFYSGAGYCL